METQLDKFTRTLALDRTEFGIDLSPAHVDRLANYYRLVLKWNPRLHLVAPCSAEEFAVRHILESLLMLKHLPPAARVTDVGSGAGLPMIPCLVARRDLKAILIESSQRKGVFLRQTLHELQLSGRSQVIVDRFENTTEPDTEFVTCRALDQFATLLPKLIAWAPRNTTFLLFAGPAILRQIESLVTSTAVERIPRSVKRFLIIARR